MLFDYLVQLVVISLKIALITSLQMLIWDLVRKQISFKFSKNFKIFRMEIFWKFAWNWFLRFLSQSSGEVVKKHLSYHENSNLVSTWARTLWSTHSDRSFKKFGRTSGRGAVFTQGGARTVVKCSLMHSLKKTCAFWLLGPRHIFKTRFCGSKRLIFFFRWNKKRLAKVSEASFKKENVAESLLLSNIHQVSTLCFWGCFRENLMFMHFDEPFLQSSYTTSKKVSFLIPPQFSLKKFRFSFCKWLFFVLRELTWSKFTTFWSPPSYQLLSFLMYRVSCVSFNVRKTQKVRS